MQDYHLLQLQSYIIPLQGNSLHYVKMGHGKKVLLAFHGFGQNHTYFLKLAQVLKEEYTLYAFDIFFHGRSTWKNCEQTLSVDEWKKYIDVFLSRHQMTEFSIIGYSIGAKLALVTVSITPEKVNQLILIAPDGIKINIWYSLTTQVHWIRKIFRSTVTKPQLFFFLVQTLQKLQVLENGIAKFAKSQMNSRKKRYRVYCTWVHMSKLIPNTKQIADLINQHAIEVEVFLGSYDRIIRKKNIKGLLKRLKNYQLTILEKGHNTLIDDVADYYQKKN